MNSLQKGVDSAKVFLQFSDGWWKFGQTKNLTVHDNNASWSNGGYQSDFVESENNMNEEWFGICAKGPSDVTGLYTLYPRAAYYALKKVHEYDPYGSDANSATLESFFSNEINLSGAALEARGDKAALESQIDCCIIVTTPCRNVGRLLNH